MPTARDMTLTRSNKALLDAARARTRIRVEGRVMAVGDGYSGSYRNRWLEVACASSRVHLTASRGSRLGTLMPGSVVDLVVTLTGKVDVCDGVYYARDAQLIDATAVMA